MARTILSCVDDGPFVPEATLPKIPNVAINRLIARLRFIVVSQPSFVSQRPPSHLRAVGGLRIVDIQRAATFHTRRARPPRPAPRGAKRIRCQSTRTPEALRQQQAPRHAPGVHCRCLATLSPHSSHRQPARFVYLLSEPQVPAPRDSVPDKFPSTAAALRAQ